ncbi:hypothetical protein E2562_018690 [Oryza meyeriana var. granulata]|uniref:Uncharacterized protein n=1 Tax=Oryza meyeriana var. granulata TaxID=110450 RepID=A0A6G1EMN1_9ORYZ|nr:hypothetical protein E2562_018690 [Oryza meyeriana var. granulata]
MTAHPSPHPLNVGYFSPVSGGKEGPRRRRLLPVRRRAAAGSIASASASLSSRRPWWSGVAEEMGAGLGMAWGLARRGPPRTPSASRLELVSRWRASACSHLCQAL